MALRRIERDPPVCEVDRDCITGSHCDAVTSRCKWQCIADTDCGPAARCTDSGTCTVESRPGAGRFTARSATDGKGCALLPPAELIRVLTTLNDEEVTCAHGDVDCACGSYCNGLTGLCEVDCIAGVNNLPASIPGCETGKVCTSLGRCAASSSTPPPPIHALTLQLSPVVISGNPASGPVLVPATVSVIANSLDFLKSTQPATVRYRILTQPGVALPPPGTIPQVKCAPDASLADHCDLTGWSFHVDTGSLVSDPRTIWVQLPKTASAAEWTLEARSDWSLNPAIAVVSADPVAFPTTDPGHYTGTMTWDNHGATGTIGRLTVPIEAFVSATNVALYEPTRIVLPDGHAVFSRDATKVTMVGWLASGTSRYDVKLGLAVGTYNSATGHLDATGSYQTGSLRQTPITLSLQRTSDTGVASCPTSGSCATGSYCDAVMNLCLPGTGATAGAGIVAATAATPTTTLPSSLLAAWNASLTTVQNSSPLLSGSTLRERFDRPYCFQSSAQTAPAVFALGTTLLVPSNDLACNIGGGEQPQTTFPFENLQQELGQDGNGNAFNLTTDCASELDVQPSTSLPGLNKCVSLPRFLMALRADQIDDVGYRLKTQLLRQWLGVNAYVASTTVQKQPYEEALGVSGQPPAARMAQALDRMDRNLAVLLDPSARTYYAPDNGSATRVDALPDYRPKSRPVARWTFNNPSSSIANAETATSGPATLTCNPMFLANARLERTWGAGQDFQACQGTINGPATVTPRTGGPSWTVVAAVEMTKPNWFTFFQEGVLRDLLGNGQLTFLSSKVFSAGRFTDILNVTHWAVKLQNNTVGFGGPGVAFPDIQVDSTGTKLGLLAFVANNGQYTLMQALPGQAVRVYTGTPYGVGNFLGGIIPWVDTGNFETVAVGELTVNDGSKSSVDEISLWSRGLTVDEFALMASRYNFTPTNDSLPPVSQEQPLAGDQAVGLPVHLIETASADLKLLGAYVEADKNLVYSQCLSGQHAELDAMFDRVGRGLRTISILQDEAASIVATVGTSAPWYPRYQADLTELAGRRAKLISALVELQRSECKNPLGISEGDLPLYVGSTGNSAAERFFASSRFLANAALGEISAAGGESGVDGLLAQARSAYNAARTSKFQEAQGAHDSADRILRISVDYETQLKRYCGAPANEDVAHGVFPLVAGFQSGAYTAANCFLKSELAECVGLGDTPLEKIPAHCLRGEMGERVLAIQAAIVDSDNASKAYDRAQAQFDADMAYCGRLKSQLDGDLELLEKHQDHMYRILLEKEAMAGSWWSKIKAFASATLSKGLFGITEQMAFNFGGFEQREIQEQNAYEAEKLARGNATEIMACTQKADDQKFAIDAARDTTDRAFQQTQAAGLGFNSAANLVASIAAEGAGQLAIEQQIDRTPPHLHYWLDQSISAYHAHMAYARRLTYLAVRAYEYESQSSSSLRSDVLNAMLPNDLKTVANKILGATAPIAGRRIDQGPLVLSLRDDVLHLVDLSKNSSRLDGTAPLTPSEAFKQLLKSDATRIYDQSGRYVGHGIRFSLRPEEVDAQTCAERISRIMPSVTLSNASQEITHTRLILAATNTFGSQQCGPVVPGPLLFARVQPSQALLVGDVLPNFPDPSPFSTTGLFPLFNMARDALRNATFPGDDASAFAGRGRYGNYILIFPDDPKACTPSLCDGWSEDALDKVDDVLLRFDFVEQDNTHL